MFAFGDTTDNQPPWKLPPSSGVDLVLPEVLTFGSLSVIGHMTADQQHFK